MTTRATNAASSKSWKRHRRVLLPHSPTLYFQLSNAEFWYLTSRTVREQIPVVWSLSLWWLIAAVKRSQGTSTTIHFNQESCHFSGFLYTWHIHKGIHKVCNAYTECKITHAHTCTHTCIHTWTYLAFHGHELHINQMKKKSNWEKLYLRQSFIFLAIIPWKI